MTRRLAWALVLASIPALAAERPAFEVASIRPAEPGRGGLEVAPGSVTMRNAPLRRVITWAYDIGDYQFSGPGWLDTTVFTITAKAGTPAKEDEMRLMLQALLAERFKLVVHKETKEMPALMLTVAKGGHKLQPTETEGNPSFQTGKLNLTGKGATIAQFDEVPVLAIAQSGDRPDGALGPIQLLSRHQRLHDRGGSPVGGARRRAAGGSAEHHRAGAAITARAEGGIEEGAGRGGRGRPDGKDADRELTRTALRKGRWRLRGAVVRHWERGEQ